MRLPQAYIVGPYSNDEQTLVLINIHAVLLVALKAANAGFLPIVPHTMQNHHVGTWDDAMDRCRYLIRGLDPKQDVIILAPNWEHSRGSREEVMLAQFLSIKIIDSKELPC